MEDSAIPGTTSPRRYVLALLAFAAGLVCLGLARWQWTRLTARRAANTVALAARVLPTLDLNGTPGARPEGYRRVILRGTYDRGFEIVLRGRAEAGTPGVQVVTALYRPGQDTAILINRGFLPAPDALTPDRDAPVPEGEVTIEGVAFPLPEAEDSGAPLVRSAGNTWRRLDLSLRARAPYPLAPYYVLLSPDDASHGWPHAASPPPLDDGPHLSYTLQWIGIAGVAFAFGVVVLRKSGAGENSVSSER